MNYGELKTQIANWLNRSDLTSQIPTFIEIASGRINRSCKVRAFVARSRASMTAGQQYLQLPEDYLGARNIQWQSSPPRALKYLPLAAMDEKRFEINDTSGIPEYYSVFSDVIEILPTPSADGTIEIIYQQRPGSLSIDTDTNYILTNAPDVYLYGALSEAHRYLGDEQQSAQALLLSNQAITELLAADSEETFSGNRPRLNLTPFGAGL